VKVRLVLHDMLVALKPIDAEPPDSLDECSSAQDREAT
jgi:hypothetical protein